MKWSNYLKIGLFFIGIGTAGTVYIVRSTDGFNDLNTKVYQVIIDDATGLTTNSKVYLAGVPVGKIQSITIKDDKAILKVAFLKNVELRQDAVIHRRASSILGTSILALSPGTELSPILKEGSTIEAAPSMADTSAIMNSVQDLSRQLNQILKEFQERQMALLAVSLETFNSIARKIDAQTEQQLERVSRILEASATISEQVERILAEREKDVTVSLTELRQSLENLRAITEEIRQGQGSIGKLLYDEELYNSLLATARETEAAAAKLEATIESIQTLANNTNTVVVDAGNLVSQVNRLEVQIDSQARYAIGNG
ncbi:MAG TPA: MlaD family protein, partial [Termitinemataceae bacterium]|nr:MlaD family protein [Termitinemataceae bacterium]